VDLKSSASHSVSRLSALQTTTTAGTADVDDDDDDDDEPVVMLARPTASSESSSLSAKHVTPYHRTCSGVIHDVIWLAVRAERKARSTSDLLEISDAKFHVLTPPRVRLSSVDVDETDLERTKSYDE